MASIRYRVDRLLRAIETALGDGLAAQVTAINADLESEGVAWRLPTGLGAEHVRVRAQAERTPLQRPESGVEIRITPLRDDQRPRGAVKLATLESPIEVTLYLHVDALTDADTTDDGDLTQAALALTDAMWWAWRAAPKETYLTREDRDREVLLVDFDDDNEVATEAIARQTWTFGLKTLRQR